MKHPQVHQLSKFEPTPYKRNGRPRVYFLERRNIWFDDLKDFWYKIKRLRGSLHKTLRSLKRNPLARAVPTPSRAFMIQLKNKLRFVALFGRTSAHNFGDWLKKRSQTLSRKGGFSFPKPLLYLLIGLLLGLWLAKPAAQIIPESSPPLKYPAQAQTIAQTALKPQSSLSYAFVPKPVPAAATSVTGGCTTGYFTGSFYEDYIINHESGGNSCATNYLGCFGLMQACPGQPLRSACGGNPACQIDWFYRYKVLPTYGSWAAVYQHEVSVGWW